MGGGYLPSVVQESKPSCSMTCSRSRLVNSRSVTLCLIYLTFLLFGYGNEVFFYGYNLLRMELLMSMLSIIYMMARFIIAALTSQYITKDEYQLLVYSV